MPDRLHRELARRAPARGQTLTDYIQELVEREIARPPATEVFHRIEARPTVRLGRPAAELIQEERAARGGLLSVVVADASALLEYLLGTDAAAPVGAILRMSDVDMHVPVLCDVEVVAGLRRALLRQTLSHRRADEALQDYLDLPLIRHGHQGLLTWMLELRTNFSAYDAMYVALADHLPGELLTCDRHLSRAVRTHTAVGVLP